MVKRGFLWAVFFLLFFGFFLSVSVKAISDVDPCCYRENCPPSVDCGGNHDVPSPAGCGESCSNGVGCQSGLICDVDSFGNKVCSVREGSVCNSDGDCQCSDGSGVYPACVNGNDGSKHCCDDSTKVYNVDRGRCVDSDCSPEGFTCEYDSDCCSGLVCEFDGSNELGECVSEGSCSGFGEGCSGDSDCCSGLVCNGDGVCAESSVETDCWGGVDEDLDGLVDCDDPDCASDSLCAYCESDGDCPQDPDCYVGRCVDHRCELSKVDEGVCGDNGACCAVVCGGYDGDPDCDNPSSKLCASVQGGDNEAPNIVSVVTGANKITEYDKIWGQFNYYKRETGSRIVLDGPYGHLYEIRKRK